MMSTMAGLNFLPLASITYLATSRSVGWSLPTVDCIAALTNASSSSWRMIVRARACVCFV